MPHRTPWIALVGIAVALFVGALDLTMTASVLPQLIGEFNIRLIPPPGDLAKAVWIVNGYLVAYVVTMPIMGRVSDLVGRRAIYIAALTLFAVGSAWAATTDSLWPMVAARVVQALGGGAMVPVALATVSDLVPVQRRPIALGLVAAIDTAGWVAGPAYGAWISSLWGWRWLFWINVPLAVIAALLIWVALPRVARQGHRLDGVGIGLLTLALLTFTIGLYLSAPATPDSGFATAALASRWTWPLLALSALAVVGFIAWERRVAEPLLDLGLLASRPFAAANLVSLLTGVILMAVMVEIPVLLQALSRSMIEATVAAGGLLAWFAAGMVIGAIVAGPLLRPLSPRAVTLGGLLLMSGGLWWLARWQLGAGTDALALPLALAGFGIGLVTTPLATSVIEQVAESERGIASSLLLVARLLGMTLGLSVLVTWALRHYERLLAAQALPSLSDPDALGRMIQIAAQVSAIVVTDLFRVTAVIGLVALIPALMLRRATARA